VEDAGWGGGAQGGAAGDGFVDADGGAGVRGIFSGDGGDAERDEDVRRWGRIRSAIWRGLMGGWRAGDAGSAGKCGGVVWSEHVAGFPEARGADGAAAGTVAAGGGSGMRDGGEPGTAGKRVAKEYYEAGFSGFVYAGEVREGGEEVGSGKKKDLHRGRPDRVGVNAEQQSSQRREERRGETQEHSQE